MKSAVPQVVEADYSVLSGVTWLHYRELASPHLIHGIAVFRDQDPCLGFDEWFKAVSAAVKQYVEFQPRSVVIPDETHSSIVKTVGRRSGRPGMRCDALVTDEARVMIGVSVADCIPLFAVNMIDHVLGIAHCGWRGIRCGIVEEFCSTHGTRTRHSLDTHYLIGPSIGACCYEVGQDLLSQFSREEAESFSRTDSGRVYFDLKSLVVSRLVKAGIGAGQISIDNTCTSCKKYILSSYRGDRSNCGRMLALLMLT